MHCSTHQEVDWTRSLSDSMVVHFSFKLVQFHNNPEIVHNFLLLRIDLKIRFAKTAGSIPWNDLADLWSE
ncbi:unnamed protein product [Urochloa humidicola]